MKNVMSGGPAKCLLANIISFTYITIINEHALLCDHSQHISDRFYFSNLRQNIGFISIEFCDIICVPYILSENFQNTAKRTYICEKYLNKFWDKICVGYS